MPSSIADRAIPIFAGSWMRAFSGEALLFELAVEDLRRAADLFAPIHEHTASMIGYRLSLAAPRLRRQSDRQRGQSTSQKSQAAQLVHQDSRHQGRRAGDRRGDLLRRAGERHSAFHRRSLPGRRRCLPTRPGATSQSWLKSLHPFSGVAFYHSLRHLRDVMPGQLLRTSTPLRATGS